MDVYGIAAASISLHAAKLSQSVGIALLDKTMELEADAMARMLDAVDAVGAPEIAPPPSDHMLDVLV